MVTFKDMKSSEIFSFCLFYDKENENIYLFRGKAKVTGSINEGWNIEKDKLQPFSVEGNALDYIIERINNPDIYLVGYNSLHYDNQLLNFFIKNYKEYGYIRQLVFGLYNHSSNIIYHDNRDYKYNLPFRSIDLMRILQVGMSSKALKLIATNLKWPLIQDLPFQPDAKLERTDLDVLLEYNINDVNITEAIYRHLREDIILRYNISKEYNIHVLDESKSGVANKFLDKIYCDYTGKDIKEVRELYTYPEVEYALSNIISDCVKFKSQYLQHFLFEMKHETIKPDQKYGKRIRINNTTYDIGKGGLHSVHSFEIYHKEEGYLLIDADVKSYYPSIMLNGRIKPAHMNDDFLEVVKIITEERLRAKANKDKIKAETLKIAINSIYGKYGFKGYWLHDQEALLKVTFNGQLQLLMLIEALENAGFNVIYANTDGVTARVKETEKDKFYKICSSWEKYTNFELEFALFKTMILSNVNNYIIVKDGVSENDLLTLSIEELKKQDKIKLKGSLDPYSYKDLTKGFEMPIIPIAVFQYLINRVPVETTINNNTDILDFCTSGKIDKKFSVIYKYIKNDEIREEVIQQTNRILVTTSKHGGIILKASGDKTIRSFVGENVLLVNDLDALKAKYPLIPVNRAYYIREARKIISSFLDRQLAIF